MLGEDADNGSKTAARRLELKTWSISNVDAV